MEIIKKDSFRSNGTKVNESDDMYRVVIVVSIGKEFYSLKNFVESFSTSDNIAILKCENDDCNNDSVYHLCKTCMRKDAEFYAQQHR